MAVVGTHVRLGLIARMAGSSQVVMLPWKMAAATGALSLRVLLLNPAQARCIQCIPSGWSSSCQAVIEHRVSDVLPTAYTFGGKLLTGCEAECKYGNMQERLTGDVVVCCDCTQAKRDLCCWPAPIQSSAPV